MSQRINFNKKTVFVVGAGASLPYGYPLGAELVDNVVTAAEKRNDTHAKKLIELIKFHDPLSIDNFLAQHCAGNKELTNIGKQLIAECILSCEDRNKISGKGNGENWYRYLAHAMFEDKERLINEPLPFKIITFNYDVSLDYYLLERVWRATMLNDDEKMKVLGKLRDAIIHVYGTVREVPWNNPEVLDGFADQINKEGFPYLYGALELRNYSSDGINRNTEVCDTEYGKDFIATAAKRIHVIGEERRGTIKLLQTYKHDKQTAERITFLGFGFDRKNMSLLWDNVFDNNHKGIEIFYTNYGDSEKLNRRIEEYFPKEKIGRFTEEYFPKEKIGRFTEECFLHFKSIKSVYEALTQDFDLD